MTHTNQNRQSKNNLVLLEKRALSGGGYIAVVALNRPDKKNAMSFTLLRQLKSVAKSIGKDRRIRVAVLTGAGGVFSAGIDLKDLGNPKNLPFSMFELLKPSHSLFQEACLVWQKLPIPVIAVMEGYCIGAGMQLALAADMRISSPHCQHAIMESRWGLVPDMGLTTSGAGLIRTDVLKELVMSARMVDGSEAQKLGLTTHISDTPLDSALLLAEELATRSPDAVLAAKRIVNNMVYRSRHASYAEKWWQLKLMLGKNARIAMREKDTPKFKLRQLR